MAKNKAGLGKVVGRIPRQRPVHSELWIGGRSPSIVTVEQEDGTIVDSHVVAWLDEEGVLVSATVVAAEEPNTCVGDWLRKATQEPFFGTPRLPTCVRVETADLADAVRNEFGSAIEIEIAPTPVVEEVARAFDEQAMQDADERSYLDDEGIEPDLVGAFFAAARRLAEHAPWQLLHTDEYFVVALQSEGLDDAVLSITGLDFSPAGFMLFPSFESFVEVMDAEDVTAASQTLASESAEGGCLVVSLASEFDVSELMRDEAEEHGWELGADGLLPIVHRMLGAAGLRRPSAHDYRLATALCEALCEVDDNQLAEVRDQDLEVPDLVYTASNGIEVALEFPDLLPDWEDVVDDAGDSADEADATAAPSLVRKIPTDVYQGLIALDYLSSRARSILNKASPAQDGAIWRLDAPADDIEHVANLLLAFARKKTGSSSLLESIEARGLNALFTAEPATATVIELDRYAASASQEQSRTTPARGKDQSGKKRAPSLYQLKVTLQGIKPPIWRRIEVPSDINLTRLHHVLQSAMGWTDSHLHMFDCEGVRFGVPDPDFDFDEVIDERTVRLSALLEAPKQRVDYIYDFGDDWTHRIVLEKISPLPKPEGQRKKFRPRCTGGRRACPPEDCGGRYGYPDLLDALSNSRHPEHSQMTEWVGGHFDPDRFEPGFDL